MRSSMSNHHTIFLDSASKKTGTVFLAEKLSLIFCSMFGLLNLILYNPIDEIFRTQREQFQKLLNAQNDNSVPFT